MMVVDCYIRLFVDELFDEASIREHDGRASAQLERVHAAIFLCPFRESRMGLVRIFATPWSRLTSDVLLSWEFGEDSQ